MRQRIREDNYPSMSQIESAKLERIQNTQESPLRNKLTHDWIREQREYVNQMNDPGRYGGFSESQNN